MKTLIRFASLVAIPVALCAQVRIASISPLSAPQGTATAVTVTINGSGFCTAAPPAVQLGSTTLTPSNLTATQMTVSVPPALLATAGSSSFTVTNPGAGVCDTTTSNFPFIVSSGVVNLASVNPTAYTPNLAANFNFVLGGTGLNGTVNCEILTAGSGTTTPIQVTGTGTQATLSFLGDSGFASFTFVVACTDPLTGTPGTPVLVTANPPPALTALQPSKIAPNPPHSFTLTITGSNFFAVPSESVLFGTSTYPATFVNNNTITTTIPASDSQLAAAGTIAVSVLTADGTRTATRLPFTVGGSGPVLGTLTPNLAVAGGGPGSITTGPSTTFDYGNVLIFGGTPLATTFTQNLAQLSATIPGGLLVTPGLVQVTAQDAGGNTSAPVSFTIVGPTLITASPSATPAGTPGLLITLNGQNFGPRSQVLWNGSPTGVTTTSVNPSQLTALLASSLLTVPTSATISVANTPTAISNTTPFTVTPLPAITLLTPAAVPAGSGPTPIQVSGNNFCQTPVPSVLLWNGTPLTASVQTTSVITATVPANLLATPGTATVQVQSSAQCPNPGTSAAATFTINAPSITQLNPSSAAAGTTNFSLTVSGANFVSGSQVLWNGSATGVTTTFVSAGQLTAQIANNLLAQPAVATITVTNTATAVSGGATFTVTGAPAITGLTPSSVPAGTPGLANTSALQVAGTFFCVSPPSVVLWNGAALATTVQSTSLALATVPANLLAAAGTASVQVQNPAQCVNPGTSAAATFTIAGPTLTSVTPQSVAAGGAAFTLTVNGANFLSTSTVQWNGSGLTTVFVNSGQLTATAPASLIAQPGSATVTVLNPGGSSSGQSAVTIFSLPTVTGLNPSSIPVGSGATTLTVTGTGFCSQNPLVLWNIPGVNPITLSTSYVSATQLTATVPATLTSSVMTARLTVQNGTACPNPGISAGFPIQVTAPALTQITPSVVSAGDNTFALTLTGSSFISTSQVNFNSTALTTAFVSGTALTATVPANLVTTAGSATITVTNPVIATFGASAVSNGLPLTVQPAPTITSMNPNQAVNGSAALNASVNGSNFPNGSVVLWNGTPLSTTFTSASQLTVTIPASLLVSIGAATIRVQSPGGAMSNAIYFAVTGRPLTITTTSLPNASPGGAYSAILNVSGGIPPYAWSLINAPSGFAIDVSTGTITGQVAAQASDFSITVMVTDSSRPVNGVSIQNTATKTFGVAVVAPPLSILTQSLVAGTVGSQYAFGLVATGGTRPYSWSVRGNLPAGLQFDPLGILRGIPTASGAFPLTFTVTDNAGQTATAPFTLTINPQSLTIVTSTIPDASTGVAYSQTLQATGGLPPYVWSLQTSSNAPGIGITPGGVLTGTPSATGSFHVDVTVVDSTGNASSRSYPINVAQGVTISTNSLPDGIVGGAYMATVSATGGRTPYQWSATGLPSTLTIDPASGAITGTPQTAGPMTAVITVTDGSGQSATKTLPFNILPPLTITTGTVAGGTVGQSYTATVQATGGTPPYSFTGTGLPDGLTISASGVISGVPTKAGSFQVVVTVTDGAKRTTSQKYTVTVGSTLTLTSGSPLPGGTVGTAYSFSFQASGGTGTLQWSASGLPQGFQIDAGSGALTGTPATPGAFNFSVTVSDAASASVTKSFAVTFVLPAVAPVNVTGIPSTPQPNQQPVLGIGLGSPYPVDVAGTMTLTFASDAGSDDPAIQFSTGGRTAAFTVPANSTAGTFDKGTTAVLTGTVAGLITLTIRLTASGADITPTPAPTVTIRVPRAAPTITGVTVARNGSGFTVTVTGFSTTREVSQGNFVFNGTNLQSSSFTVDVKAAFTQWFGSSASAAFGGQFVLSVPFTVQGSATAITSVSVTLTNSVGVSGSVSASF